MAEQLRDDPSQGKPDSSPEVPRNVSKTRLPGTPNSLPQIRKLVVEAAERCGFADEDVGKIEMAVGEACSNIIEHAYRTQPQALDIELHISEFPNRMEIIILDYSTINFPVDAAPGVDLDTYLGTDRRRGLGLYIIRSFVDHVEHRFICGQGNELRLVKYLG
ncbi:MAG: ATP-binding protein [Armatimonadota bacterium]|nr:ATP-binding protein [Armatimonadota bacterium]